MGKSGGSETTNYEYYQDAYYAIAQGPLKRIRRIWFDNDVVYDDRPEQAGWSGRPITADGRRPALASYLISANITVQLGTQTQARWNVYEAAIGTANCPAMRGRACLGFKDLPIHKFGGRLPGISVEAESEDADANGRSTLVYIVGNIMDQAQFPSGGSRDLSQLAGILVDGYLIAQRTEARQQIAPLQDAFFFDLVDIDYQEVAVLRGQDAIGTVDAAHLGCGSPDPQSQNYVLTRGQAMERPERTDVVYQSAAIDFQTFTQTTNRESTLQRKVAQYQLPVVMSESAAMAVARKQLALGQLNDVLKLHLPMRYLAWTPGDVINMPWPDGRTETFRIERQLIGLFGQIEFTLAHEDKDIYTLTGEGAAPPSGGGGGVQEAWPPVIYAADLNALLDLPDQSFDGCSLIVIIGTARNNWPGATAKCEAGIRRFSGGVTSDITTHALAGSIGNLTAVLTKYRGPNVWDETSVLRFQMASVYSAVGDDPGTNTGNGTIVMSDPSTAGGVIPGTYLATFTNATNFTVTDPTSATVGSGTTGTEFANEVVFTITAGGTAFIAGDHFNITVSAVGNVIGTPPAGSTDAEVLDGANILVCEGEIIQFVSAVDLGNNTYELTRLLRGRRGTEHIAWDDHASGASLAFLPAGGVPQRFRAALSEVGSTKQLNAFDAGKAGATYSNTPHTSVDLEGNCRKPWSPGAVDPLRSGDDVISTWEYRSRWGDELEDGGDGSVPLGEAAEVYDLEIYDSTFVTLKRTVLGLTSPTWTYTSAMQTTDFGTGHQSPYGMVIYQVSELVGRGFPSRTLVSI